MMNRDLRFVEMATEMPDRFGPFEPWFFYGVMSIEIPMILCFAYAIIQGILKRKQLQDHSWWLVSTVFVIMFPALGRGVQNVYVGLNIKDWPAIDIMLPLYIAIILIILMTLFAANKFGKLKHPATYLAVGINLYVFFLEPLGRSEWIQYILTTFIKS